MKSFKEFLNGIIDIKENLKYLPIDLPMPNYDLLPR